MPKYITWADQALARNIAAPGAEKQHTGWVAEQPPHEYFNWHMNRTDSRLTNVEQPWILNTLHSPKGQRESVITAGTRFEVPVYIVGSGHLQVFLDGVPCIAGATNQYVEIGEVGLESTGIRWNDNIDATYDILVRAPMQVSENVGVLTPQYITELNGNVDSYKAQVKEAEFNIYLGMSYERAMSVDMHLRQALYLFKVMSIAAPLTIEGSGIVFIKVEGAQVPEFYFDPDTNGLADISGTIFHRSL